MKKYDLILYNGEEILELRLNLLYKYVDYFVIVEFDRTFQNKKKPYYFDIKKFKKFKKKIIYKKKTLPKNYRFKKTTWEIQTYQRESLDKGLNIKDKDMIILADADEIIDPSKLRYKYNEIERYELLNLRFYGNYINLSSPGWIQPLSTSYNVAKAIGLEALKASHRAMKPGDKYGIYRQYTKHRKNNLIKKAGWHFSSLKTHNNKIVTTVRKKLEEYSHAEFKNKIVFNTDIINFKIKYGLEINTNGPPHLWGSLNEKIIKNKKVFKWLKKNNLFYKRKFNYIKPNFKNIYPYPSKFLIKIIVLINYIVYFIFNIQNVLKKIKF